MDPKLDDLLARTNVRDMLDPPLAQQIDLRQPIAPPEVAPREPLRSTTDPLQSQFATVDIVGALHHSKTSPMVKGFALVFLGGPLFVMGLMLVATAWASDIGVVRQVFGIVSGLVIAGFYPYIVFVRGRSGPKGRP